MQSPTLLDSTISAWSIASPREQRAHPTADTAGHHPTDDEADDSIPGMMWLSEQFAWFRGKS
jgi:hypothetical protein